MSVLVTGSVAVDHIMVFEDHFRNHFVSDKLEKLNVAFHVPQMTKKYGGTGGNIAYNLARLGIDPILLVLSFFVFGALFGMFGVLLAVPIMSVVKTLFEELVMPEIDALAAERREGAGATGETAFVPAVPTFGDREPAEPEADNPQASAPEPQAPPT